MHIKPFLPLLVFAATACNSPAHEHPAAAPIAVAAATNENPAAPVPAAGTLSCLINGQAFTATQMAAARTEVEVSDGTLQILGLSEKTSIELLLPNKEATTGATVKAEGGIVLNLSNPAKTESYLLLPEKKATVVVTKRTAGSISGTFSGTAYMEEVSGKSVAITNGKFTVPIEAGAQ